MYQQNLPLPLMRGARCMRHFTIIVSFSSYQIARRKLLFSGLVFYIVAKVLLVWLRITQLSVCFLQSSSLQYCLSGCSTEKSNSCEFTILVSCLYDVTAVNHCSVALLAQTNHNSLLTQSFMNYFFFQAKIYLIVKEAPLQTYYRALSSEGGQGVKAPCILKFYIFRLNVQ